MSSPTVMTMEHHQRVAAARGSTSSKSIWTRSTIYNRHEKRRAKTLQQANDTRPAIVRVLAQLSNHVPAALSTPTLKAATTTPSTAAAAAPLFVDTTVFSNSASPLLDNNNSHKNTSAPALNPWTTALSAAVGARFSQVVSWHAETMWRQVTLPSHPTVTLQPQGLALVAPPASSSSSFPVRSQLRAATLAPVVVLFGTQAWVESKFGNEGPLASVVGSGVAGVAVGMWNPTFAAPTALLQQAGAAICYFGMYRFLSNALNKNQQEKSLVATATAGAIAGSGYEILRTTAARTPMTTLLCNVTPSTVATSPFATQTALRIPSLMARAAPVHALLFVGYEAAQSLWQ